MYDSIVSTFKLPSFWITLTMIYINHWQLRCNEEQLHTSDSKVTEHFPRMRVAGSVSTCLVRNTSRSLKAARSAFSLITWKNYVRWTVSVSKYDYVGKLFLFHCTSRNPLNIPHLRRLLFVRVWPGALVVVRRRTRYGIAPVMFVGLKVTGRYRDKLNNWLKLINREYIWLKAFPSLFSYPGTWHFL